MNNLEIKKIREKLDLTQKELAEKLNLHYRTLQKWESGETKIKGPSVFMLEQLLKKHTKGVLTNNGEIKNSNINSDGGRVKVGATDNDQIKELTQIVKTAQDQQTKLMEQLSESQKHLSESQKQVSNLIEIISNKLK